MIVMRIIVCLSSGCCYKLLQTGQHRLQMFISPSSGGCKSTSMCPHCWVLGKGPFPALQMVIFVYAKSLQSCPTLCNPMECSPPGSSVHRIFQARIWSGLPCPSPGDLPDPEIETVSSVAPALQTDSLPLSHQGSPQMVTFVLKWQEERKEGETERGRETEFTFLCYEGPHQIHERFTLIT